jgi:3-oxoacyl-[acyl-carrier-protein] synthase II
MIRVVITGMGAITPLGNSVKEFWNNIVSGKKRCCAYHKI